VAGAAALVAVAGVCSNSNKKGCVWNLRLYLPLPRLSPGLLLLLLPSWLLLELRQEAQEQVLEVFDLSSSKSIDLGKEQCLNCCCAAVAVAVCLLALPCLQAYMLACLHACMLAAAAWRSSGTAGFSLACRPGLYRMSSSKLQFPTTGATMAH